jgi:hypothetical protein
MLKTAYGLSVMTMQKAKGTTGIMEIRKCLAGFGA